MSVVLPSPSSFPDGLRERWWLPSPDALDRVIPGAEVKVLAAEPVDDGGVDPFSGRLVTVEPRREAPPGDHRLSATGEVVVDPDYVCSWTLER